MGHLYAWAAESVYTIIMLAIHLLETMGFIIILMSAVRAFKSYWHNRNGNPFHTCRLSLAEGLATGLEFKLGGEILRTLVVREWEEIVVLGAIIALRMGMALLIYWEIKQEGNIQLNGETEHGS